MALITDIMGAIDSAAADVLTASAYGTLATSLSPVVRLGSIMLVMLFGANIILQIVPTSPGSAFMTMLKICLVGIFFDSWANFYTVYHALTNTPAELGATILQGFGLASEGNLYDSLDQVYSTVLDVANSIAENGGWFAGPLSALVVFLVAALMATISIFVLGIAKIGIAVFGAIAPAMIACALFRPTMPIFEAWIKQAITFAFIPLLVSVVSGVIFAMFATATPGSLTTITTLGEAISFIVVSMVGTGLILQIPSMAGAFGQTAVAVGAVAANAYASSKAAPGQMVKSGQSAAGAAIKGGKNVGSAADFVTSGKPSPAAAMMMAFGSGGTTAAAGAASSVARGLNAAEGRLAAATSKGGK